MFPGFPLLHWQVERLFSTRGCMVLSVRTHSPYVYGKNSTSTTSEAISHDIYFSTAVPATQL